jgi:hypothetical protein
MNQPINHQPQWGSVRLAHSARTARGIPRYGGRSHMGKSGFTLNVMLKFGFILYIDRGHQG